MDNQENKYKMNIFGIKTPKKDVGTQSYLRIAEIREDTVVLKNGGVRAVLEVMPVNFNLKSEDEQNAIIYSYQNFLNMLEFPIQIVVQSRKIDLDSYLENIKKNTKNDSNNLLKAQGVEYINFINRLVEYADIMEKKFYVIIPFNPYRIENQNFLQKFISNLKHKETTQSIEQKHKEFQYNLKNLTQRVNVISAALESMGLKNRQLTTKELIELFYKIYNPEISRGQKIENLEEHAFNLE